MTFIGKALIPTDTFTENSAEEWEDTFGNLRWISDKLVMVEIGPTKIDPVTTYSWPSGTRLVLSWEEP